jgi:hypothetical protein
MFSSYYGVTALGFSLPSWPSRHRSMPRGQNAWVAKLHGTPAVRKYVPPRNITWSQPRRRRNAAPRYGRHVVGVDDRSDYAAAFDADRCAREYAAASPRALANVRLTGFKLSCAAGSRATTRTAACWLPRIPLDSDARSATSMTPRRWCSAQALQRRTEAGPRQLQLGVSRRPFGRFPCDRRFEQRTPLRYRLESRKECGSCLV